MYFEEPELEMFSLSSNAEKHAFQVNFTVNQPDVLMEVDTGAAVSIISHARYKQLFAHVPLKGARVKLTYTGENIPVVGQFTVTVQYEDQVNELPLIVVRGNKSNLCGRIWLQKVKLNRKEIRYESKTKQPVLIQEVLEKYSEVFKNELGTLKHLNPNTPQLFFANSNQRHHCQPTKKITIDQNGQVLF